MQTSNILKLAACLVQAVFLTACLQKPVTEEKPLARVHENYLYPSQLASVIPPNVTGEDSARMATSFINNWVRENLLLVKAENNSTVDQQHVERLIENYRKSLLIHDYESAIISQLLDTSIAREEIETYYKSNQQEFELKDNIIKVVYIKVPKNAPQIEKVRTWYKSDKVEDIQELESYCYQFAENFYLDHENWLLFDDVLKEIPLDTYNKEEFLKNNRHIELEDSTSIYLVNIKGFRIKNSISPLAFEQENIRNILLNKRKLELVARMKADIFEEGLKKNYFEIYD